MAYWPHQAIALRSICRRRKTVVKWCKALSNTVRATSALVPTLIALVLVASTEPASCAVQHVADGTLVSGNGHQTLSVVRFACKEIQNPPSYSPRSLL